MENKYKDSKHMAVAWVRMQKNKQTNEFFFTVSIADGTKGTLKLDSAKIASVKRDPSLINKTVVGTLLVRKGEGGVLESASLNGALTEKAPDTQVAAGRQAARATTSTPSNDFDF